MNKGCIRCMCTLRNYFHVSKSVTRASTRIVGSSFDNQSHKQTACGQSICITDVKRCYSTKERTTEKKYKHGKLVVEEEEDPLLYPKFLITLSGTDEAVLENFFHFVKKAAKMTDINLTKSFPMPAHEESYRAKRVGDGLQKEVEYNFKQYQRVIEISDLTGYKVDLFLDYVQKSLPSAVQIKMELKRWEMLVDPNHITLRNLNN
ncbi:28S ribosomal protein S10, mitochondrial-like [Hydractinia symbiolongicarpus]|uniref:28S ribosomal protein S10, mitochondrial-like n=1 Tax=Hydractinia symbiolongicarpus TaxID=13093 RepID=UPI00254F3EEA|nr:28S ribosomal protein S10, mitochondrial-like [Hydractinia symbiolongicarpus]